MPTMTKLRGCALLTLQDRDSRDAWRAKDMAVGCSDIAPGVAATGRVDPKECCAQPAAGQEAAALYGAPTPEDICADD